MTKEELSSYGTMLFGIGFFLFVVWLCIRDDQKQYERRIMEMREFGTFEGKEPKRKRSQQSDPD